MESNFKRFFFIQFVLLYFFLSKQIYAKPINDIQELNGVWKCNECTVTYPFQINENDFLMVEFKKKDVTNDWFDICESRGLTFKESLLIKNVIISKIFGKDYPLANELGVNEGIKISYNENLKKPRIRAQRIILIPADVILCNLNHFDISGLKLKMTSSIIFQNSQIEDFYLGKKLNKKVLF
ncbi:MAG: hypothetical protein J6X78_03505 [Treponema sp.]|nr:hypothetical protein [Treponema sp.]